MQAQKEAPSDMQCKDKFLLQGVIAPPGATPKDVTAEMFNKESGNFVEEWKLKVAYVAPPQPPSPVQEVSKEGSSPRASVSDNGEFSASEFTAVNALISKLTQEKTSLIQQNKQLHQELDRLRCEVGRSRGGISLMYVLIVGSVGLLLGYLIKKT